MPADFGSRGLQPGDLHLQWPRPLCQEHEHRDRQQIPGINDVSDYFPPLAVPAWSSFRPVLSSASLRFPRRVRGGSNPDVSRLCGQGSPLPEGSRADWLHSPVGWVDRGFRYYPSGVHAIGGWNHRVLRDLPVPFPLVAMPHGWMVPSRLSKHLWVDRVVRKVAMPPCGSVDLCGTLDGGIPVSPD